MHISITHIDTACILLEIGGYRILTDPSLDEAGHLYYHGAGAFSRKTDNPALQPEEIGTVDLILLSHHQHKDNFDHKGKAFAKRVSTILSTKAAAKALPGITGLSPWEQISINDPTAPEGLTITATPAQHRPWWIPEFISGPVIGFVIQYKAQQDGVIYIAGDTVYFKGIEEVASRFKTDIGIFNAGAVQFRYLTGWGKYTMDSKDLLRAVAVLKPRTIIPVHQRGWTHFKEKEVTLQMALLSDGWTRERTLFLERGERTGIR